MILSTGLSPAWQHVMLLQELQLGEVNRVKQVEWCASGKILNVAVALHLLEAHSKSLTVVGGPAGAAIKTDSAALGLTAAWVDVASMSRVCTSVIDQRRNVTTELVEPSGQITVEELRRFADVFSQEAATADYVVFTGSLPPGTPASYCRELALRTDARMIFDIRGPELVEAIEARPFLVKPNRSELAETLGHDLIDEAQLIEGMRELNRRGAQWVVVSQGEHAVLATSADEAYRVTPPSAQVVSPIGCGDCFAAGLAWGLDEGDEMNRALCRAVAAAVANLATPLPGRLDPLRVQQLLDSIRCESL